MNAEPAPAASKQLNEDVLNMIVNLYLATCTDGNDLVGLITAASSFKENIQLKKEFKEFKAKKTFDTLINTHKKMPSGSISYTLHLIPKAPEAPKITIDYCGYIMNLPGVPAPGPYVYDPIVMSQQRDELIKLLKTCDSFKLIPEETIEWPGVFMGILQINAFNPSVNKDVVARLKKQVSMYKQLLELLRIYNKNWYEANFLVEDDEDDEDDDEDYEKDDSEREYFVSNDTFYRPFLSMESRLQPHHKDIYECIKKELVDLKDTKDTKDTKFVRTNFCEYFNTELNKFFIKGKPI